MSFNYYKRRKHAKYYIDATAHATELTILRLLPYYCVLNSIEFIWNIVEY